jgi:hypothetical protein
VEPGDIWEIIGQGYKKYIKKNNISLIPSRRSDLCVTNNPNSTSKYAASRYIIQTNKIKSLLLIIRKQDHETRSFRNISSY